MEPGTYVHYTVLPSALIRMIIQCTVCWFEEYNIESVFLDCKRYKIVSTDHFPTKEDALTYINANLPFKMRAKSAGCVIINNNKNIEYLFFKHKNIKEKL